MATKTKTIKEPKAPTAKELLAEAAKTVNLDDLFARDPRTHSVTDRRGMVEFFRRERALYLETEKTKADKKDAKAAEAEPVAITE